MVGVLSELATLLECSYRCELGEHADTSVAHAIFQNAVDTPSIAKPFASISSCLAHSVLP